MKHLPTVERVRKGCSGKTWLELFVRMRIINALFEATFSKSVDRMEFH